MTLVLENFPFIVRILVSLLLGSEFFDYNLGRVCGQENGSFIGTMVAGCFYPRIAVWGICSVRNFGKLLRTFGFTGLGKRFTEFEVRRRTRLCREPVSFGEAKSSPG